MSRRHVTVSRVPWHCVKSVLGLYHLRLFKIIIVIFIIFMVSFSLLLLSLLWILLLSFFIIIVIILLLLRLFLLNLLSYYSVCTVALQSSSQKLLAECRALLVRYRCESSRSGKLYLMIPHSTTDRQRHVLWHFTDFYDASTLLKVLLLFPSLPLLFQDSRTARVVSIVACSADTLDGRTPTAKSSTGALIPMLLLLITHYEQLSQILEIFDVKTVFAYSNLNPGR